MGETNNTKQAAWIAIGSMFSFAFGIISSMILSRYFNKEDYGTYKQVIYVYNTLLTIFTLGLPKAYSYFLPKVPVNQAKSLIKKITNIFFLLGGIFTLFLFFGSSLIASLLKNPDLSKALMFFSIVPFLMLPTMGLEGVLSTYRRAKFITIYTLITRTAMLLCVVIPVIVFGCNYIGAVVGFVVASFISFLVALYLKYYPVREYANDRTLISYRKIFRFSLPLLYASIWGIIIVSADQFFISRYFGNVVFAEFSNGSLELPFIGMVISACATVLSPLFSRMNEGNKENIQNEIFPLWKSTFEKTAKLIYPILIYCWFFADIIMVVLYGSQYENSYVYFRIKLILNFFTLIQYGPLLINVGKIDAYTRVHMYTALCIVILEYTSIRLFHSSYVVIIVSVICNIFKILCLLRISAQFFSKNILDLFPLKLIWGILFPSIVFLFFEHYLFMRVFTVTPLIELLFSFFVYIVFYYIYCRYVAKIDYYELVKPLFRK